MMDDIDTGNGILNHRAISHGADHNPHTPRTNLVGFNTFFVVERDDFMTVFMQPFDECFPGEASPPR